MTIKSVVSRQSASFWGLIVAASILVLLVRPMGEALAASQVDKDNCARGTEEAKIEACTRIIGDSTESANNRAVSYNHRGIAYGRKGEHDKAISDFSQAIRLKPELASAHMNRGIALSNKREYDRAISDFDEAIRLDPGVAGAYTSRGRAYSGKGQHDRAISDHNEALRLKPDLGSAYYNRGVAFGNKGQHDRAISDFNEAIRLDPRIVGAYTYRGIAYERKGQRQQAKRDYQSALAVTPRDESGRTSQENARTRLADLEQQERVESDEKRQAEQAARQAAKQVDEEAERAKRQPSGKPTAEIIGHRVALVIGNSTYMNAPRLNNPIRDAAAVAAAFKRLGFAEVIERHDLSNLRLRDELKSFGDKAAKADWAVLYFAGHGIQVNQINYLVPTDANLRRASHVEDEAVALPYVLSKVEDARQLRLVILDACRSNPFLALMEQNSGTRSLGRGLGRIEPQKGMLVAYAARDGQLAEDGGDSNSPFTKALLESIDEPGLELGLLFRRVRDSVLSRTGHSQEPYVYGSLPSKGLYFRAPER